MIAYVYPILSIFWSMLIFFGFLVWMYLLFVCFADLFRSEDVSGWGKALWTLGFIILPLVGVLVYFIARGSGMTERAERHAEEQQAAFERSVRRSAQASADGHAPASTADALAQLVTLRDHGDLTPEEYEREKQRLLAS
jgi:hypothetical protein